MFLLCLNFLFFCFVKLALGLNNVCKVRCTNKQKRKRPLFGLYQKNHPKNKLLSAIFVYFFFLSPTLSLCVISISKTKLHYDGSNNTDIFTHTKIHLTTSIHILYLLLCSDKNANSSILPEFDLHKQMLCICLET